MSQYIEVTIPVGDRTEVYTDSDWNTWDIADGGRLQLEDRGGEIVAVFDRNCWNSVRFITTPDVAPVPSTSWDIFEATPSGICSVPGCLICKMKNADG